MWVNPTRLPQALDVSAYWDPGWHERELREIFAPAWHCVGTLDDLARPGDFLTLEVAGRPLLVRNEGGQIVAFLNVCAHRHCLLTRAPMGNMPALQCQYHGWEYDAQGKPCRVPDPRSFDPVEPGAQRLCKYRVDTCGRLVFVTFTEGGPSLAEFLGVETTEVCDEYFSDAWRQVATRTLHHPANWKVVVENSLESYHVPMVHKKTFKLLTREDHIQHVLTERFTSHEDIQERDIRLYCWLMRRLRRSPRYSYRHHHAFPNLTIACNDITSVLQVIVPVSPTSSYSIVRAYVHRGERGSMVERLISWLVARPAVWFMDTVMKEDGAIFASIQRGLRASPHAGVIGRREERVHCFQAYVHRTCGEGIGT